MTIDDQCFVSQTADEKILQHVTTVCGECYQDLHAGDVIYYDLQGYRYLCEACAEHLSERMNEACEVDEEGTGLF